jgi:hypothetical protein
MSPLGTILLTVVVAALWYGAGWRACTRSHRGRMQRLADLERRMDAYRHADTRADLDEVGPIAGPARPRPWKAGWGK